jgi:hypothetical protein
VHIVVLAVVHKHTGVSGGLALHRRGWDLLSEIQQDHRVACFELITPSLLLHVPALIAYHPRLDVGFRTLKPGLL